MMIIMPIHWEFPSPSYTIFLEVKSPSLKLQVMFSCAGEMIIFDGLAACKKHHHFWPLNLPSFSRFFFASTRGVSGRGVRSVFAPSRRKRQVAPSRGGDDGGDGDELLPRK